MSNGSEHAIRLIEETTLKGIRFYSAATYPRQIYENTGLDTSQMPAGTYVGAVKNHKLSGNQIIMIHGSPRTDDSFVYAGNEVWKHLTVQSTTHDAKKILTNKTIQYNLGLKQVIAEFVNTERGVQCYGIQGGVKIYARVRGITHSGYTANVYGLLHFSDQYQVSRTVGVPVKQFNYGNTPYSFSGYDGGVVRDAEFQYSSDYSRGKVN